MNEPPSAPPTPSTEEIQPPSRLKRFIKETVRVIRITKKPNREEFTSTLKVTSIGAAIIGAIGFVLFLLKQLLFR